MRLLFVEDDADIADAVRRNLERSGFVVDLAMNLADAVASVESQSYELVLLDLGLPDGDGLDLVRRLRRQCDPAPILILTARDAVSDRVAGLEAGADDYLIKSFAHEELLARIRALLRRPAQHLGERVGVGRLVYDPGSGTFAVGGEPLELPRRERALHLAGVVFTSLRDRVNLVKAMIIGVKELPAEEETPAGAELAGEVRA